MDILVDYRVLGGILEVLLLLLYYSYAVYSEELFLLSGDMVNEDRFVALNVKISIL